MRYIFFIVFLAMSILSGCDSGTDNPPDDNGKDSIRIDYHFRVRNLRPLRDGEYYALWVRQYPDSSWRLASDTNFNKYSIRDTISIFGRFYTKQPKDSIHEAMVTIELRKRPTTPGVPLLKGIVQTDTAILTMSHLGSFSSASGGLTFTSKSIADTEAYKREFYLLRFNTGIPEASVSFLPQLSNGWKYGLWVADYEFYPYHEFLYGLFNDATGQDSDTTNDAYPFPGGVKKQRLDVGTGRIIVTLEPPLYGDSLRYKGAELLYILQFNRIVNIERDKFYPMANVTDKWLPSGMVTFKTP